MLVDCFRGALEAVGALVEAVCGLVEEAVDAAANNSGLLLIKTIDLFFRNGLGEYFVGAVRSRASRWAGLRSAMKILLRAVRGACCLATVDAARWASRCRVKFAVTVKP